MEPPVEIEVKFYMDNPSETRKRIIALGAKHENKCFESNLRFDDPQDRLKRGKRLLRLRRADKITLTYKQRSPEGDQQFKVHRELEVVVDSFENMHSILLSLGYRQAQIYEKYRETYGGAGTKYCLDTMPYGEFLEIEGTKEAIRNAALHLDMDWKNRILLNYLEIFEKIKGELHLAFNDITFDNFRGVNADLQHIIRSCAAG